MPSRQDQQPAFLLWLVAVLFCDQRYKQAVTLIISDEISVNGQVVKDVLHLIHSGDSLLWQNQPRAVDLDALRKANALRLQIEMFLGGPEAAYKQLNTQNTENKRPE